MDEGLLNISCPCSHRELVARWIFKSPTTSVPQQYHLHLVREQRKPIINIGPVSKKAQQLPGGPGLRPTPSRPEFLQLIGGGKIWNQIKKGTCNQSNKARARAHQKDKRSFLQICVLFPPGIYTWWCVWGELWDWGENSQFHTSALLIWKSWGTHGQRT